MRKWNIPLTINIIRNMAGHSHYQNTRHIKAAKDGAKNDLTNKLAIKLNIAIKEGGGNDPKFNSKLASLIQFAKKSNVPSSTVQSILKKQKDSTDNSSLINFEFIGPGSSAIIVESFTDKPTFARQRTQGVIKLFGIKMGTPGCASHFFNYKGIIETEIIEPDPDMDSITEIAIDAGAEDVDIVYNKDGNKVLQFTCDPKELHLVQENLKNLKQDIIEANHQYIPHTLIEINETQKNSLTKLLTALEDLEFVANTYHNVS